MPTNETPKKRGRPPKYDRDTALQAAMDTFHVGGFSATSLDDLAAAMQMNRPSVYNAFGSKESLYTQALAAFMDQLGAVMSSVLASGGTLQSDLERFYRAAIDVYTAQKPARGCFVFCTAPVEAVEHPEIAAATRDALATVDAALEQRLRRARSEGELAESVDCRQTATLAQGLLHTIAIRARAGESKRSLQRTAASAAAMISHAAA